MPLLWLSDALDGREANTAGVNRESLRVVVYATGERSVGLVVDRILDIAEESFTLQPETGRPGVRGSAIIQRRITDVLDVPSLMQAMDLRRRAMEVRA